MPPPSAQSELNDMCSLTEGALYLTKAAGEVAPLPT